MLWEELNSQDFPAAVRAANGVCVIPFGVVEKHGPHLPVGTDTFVVRAVAIGAAEKEPVVVFPWYYAGQISEARHVPGTISYSPDLQMQMLRETCNEIARNGFDKIVIMNGHGGNNDMIGYFCMTHLHERRDYALFDIRQYWGGANHEKMVELLGGEDPGGHAGNEETALMLAVLPDKVRMGYAQLEDSQHAGKLKSIAGAYTPVEWYAGYPNHYAGNPGHATPDIGRKMLDVLIDDTARIFGEIKSKGDAALKMQSEYYSLCGEFAKRKGAE